MSKSKTMSWGWIVFWFIIFWPVGLFFLFKKLNIDKTATLQNSKTVSIISYVLMGMGVLYLITAISQDSTMFGAALLFGGGGIWVNRIAKKMKTTGEKYKKYIALVVNQSQSQIDSIAPAVGVSYETAKADLQKMINAGYFEGAYINDGTREIVLARQTATPVVTTSSIQAKTCVVACKSCGANNTITVGQIKECEYCGSSIE